MKGWTEEMAVSAWFEDLEAAEASAEVARTRLESDPMDPESEREACYRETAARWLDRGAGRVALALLNRGEASAELPAFDRGRRPGTVVADLDVMMTGRPGTAGLPALTVEETERLRSAEEPEEALEVVRAARRRLEVHGQEARRLLRRWLEREKGK